MDSKCTDSLMSNEEIKDAATLIILDRTEPVTKVLMGRRHEKHKFMPGLFVFPGGRLETSDAKVKCQSELETEIENKIGEKARGLAVAAVRETFEETGLLIGEKNGEEIRPALSTLRLLARAITPPNKVRRFDTWFFVTDKEHIQHDIGMENLPDNELQDIHWLTLEETQKLELPEITRVILLELDKRLDEDHELSADRDIPLYQLRDGMFERVLI